MNIDWHAIWNSVSVSAIVQIAILYVVIYTILRYAKGSRFGQVLMGVGILAAAMFVFTFVFQFDVLSTIVRSLLVYLAISTVVIFQPEIRRILSQVGAFGYFEKPKHTSDGSATPDYVVDTLISLANRRIGALIAFERGISLRSYEHTGVTTDAIFTRELVETIFTPPLPLHDGGVTIRNGRISAAHCVFPVSNNPELITDALALVVSEERGLISVAHNGRLIRYAGEQRAQSLIRWINKAMPDSRLRKGVFAKLNELLSRKGAKK